MPTKLRITAESYSASSTAGSDRLNHCCKSKCAASAPRPPADARCRPSDSGPRSGRTACPKEPPAPSPPKTMPAASACCNAQSHSSSPVSSASYWRDCTNIHCGKGELNQSLPKVNCSPHPPRNKTGEVVTKDIRHAGPMADRRQLPDGLKAECLQRLALGVSDYVSCHDAPLAQSMLRSRRAVLASRIVRNESTITQSPDTGPGGHCQLIV